MRTAARYRGFALAFFLAIAPACGSDDHAAAPATHIVDDALWKALRTEMNLPDYQVKRLETYVGTLEDSRNILAGADTKTRTDGISNLDVEVGKALPLMVPPQYTDKVHAFLSAALRGQ